MLLTSSGELKALILIAAIFIVSAIGFKLIFAKNDPGRGRLFAGAGRKTGGTA